MVMESIASTICIKTRRVCINNWSRKFNVNRNNSEELAAYVLRAATEQGISFNEVERRAKRKGYQITQSYISRIVNGAAQNPSVEKLQALAAGLNRPEEEVFAIARGERKQEEAIIADSLAKAMLFGWSQLTKQDKAELVATVKMLNDEISRRLEKQKK